MERSLGIFIITVPIRERQETHYPASGHMPAHTAVGWVTVGQKQVSVDVRVDAEALATQLGGQAARNKRRKATEASGMVQVVVKERG